ncbi:MAG: hypothetical protein MUE42_09715, partial [Opitutaceae bacterium]|nr:hypothetical protein [Opitutaceae bacterium]
LVGGEGDDAADLGVEAGVDEVLGAEDVGLDALEGVVFGGGDLLEGGGVDDDVDALESAAEALLVADIADGGGPAGSVRARF